MYRLNLLAGNCCNTLANHLFWFKRMTKYKCCQYESFGYSIIALYISSRVCFSVSLRLRICKGFNVITTLSHRTQDVVRSSIEDTSHCKDPCSSHTLLNCADHRSTSHNC